MLSWRLPSFVKFLFTSFAHFFKLDCFLDFWEVFKYSGYEHFITYSLSFYSLKNVFQEIEVILIKAPIFSSTNFILLGFTFRSMIHFELILCTEKYINQIWFFFSFLHLDIQLFHHHLLKRLCFLCRAAYAVLSKINWSYVCRFIFGLSAFFHWSICLASCQTVPSWLL